MCTSFSNNSGATSNNHTLAEGVEDLQIFYGTGLYNDRVADRYLTASNVSNRAQVVSLQVAALVSCIDNAVWGQGSVCVGCDIFTSSADNPTRAELQTTIGLRN